MTFELRNREDLHERDEQLFAMLTKLSSEGDSRRIDWVALILWALVILTVLGGATLLWALY